MQNPDNIFSNLNWYGQTNRIEMDPVHSGHVCIRFAAVRLLLTGVLYAGPYQKKLT